EIIVVDDGSTDSSVDVLKTFGDRIKWIQQKNSGPGAARNAGFSASTGDYIQFFDSDDLMTPNKLEVQASLLDENKEADFAYGPYVMAEETDDGWEQRDVILQYSPLPEKPLHEVVAKGWCTITQSCLFRRATLERAGAWRTDLMTHEDKEYWYRIGEVVKHAAHERRSCVFYRQHGVQITNKQTAANDRTKDGIHAFDLIIDQLKRDHVSFLTASICKGIRAGYIKYLISKDDFTFRNSWRNEVYYFLYRIYQKAGRIITQTNWQPADGPLDRPETFEHFKSMLNELR
ncbi:MAG TPA: hypothetical protein DGG95_16265, partial [Cytophagales bacterium]|nr:hypothetical protein [Cytophagales bacterium]